MDGFRGQPTPLSLLRLSFFLSSSSKHPVCVQIKITITAITNRKIPAIKILICKDVPGVRCAIPISSSASHLPKLPLFLSAKCRRVQPELIGIQFQLIGPLFDVLQRGRVFDCLLNIFFHLNFRCFDLIGWRDLETHRNSSFCKGETFCSTRRTLSRLATSSNDCSTVMIIDLHDLFNCFVMDVSHGQRKKK